MEINSFSLPFQGAAGRTIDVNVTRTENGISKQIYVTAEDGGTTSRYVTLERSETGIL